MFGRRTVFAVLISVLAAVALGVSAYLTWVSWQSGTVAGCTAESLLDCDDVLTSRWSKWLGLPVSLLGGATYLVILGLVWPASSKPNGVEVTSLFALAMLAAGAAIWFIGLQAIHLQSFCLYCLTIHVCGLCVGVLATLLFLDRSGGRDYDQMRTMLGVAAADAPVQPAEPAEPISATRLLLALSFAAVGLVALMGGQLLVDSGEVMAMEEVEFHPPIADSPADELDQPDEPELTNKPHLSDKPEQSDDKAVAADEDLRGENSEWVEDDLAPSAIPGLDEPQTIDSIFGTSSQKVESRLGPRTVVFDALPDGVDTGDMPVLGNPGAPHILVEMMDYTCSHCRDLHPHLEASVERYGDQLGVVIYNIPLSKKCNQYVPKDNPGKKYACDYAQLAIAVWKLAPEKYPEFHNWLLKDKKVPSITKAKKRARELAGDDVLLDTEIKADISRRLARQSTSFNKLNSGLPILLLQEGAIRGVPEESEKLFEYLERKLGVEPK